MGGEVVDGFPVSICRVAKPTGLIGDGKIGHSWGKESVLDTGDEEGGFQAMVGHFVTVGSLDFADQFAGFESAQVIGNLSGSDLACVQNPQLRRSSSEVFVGKPVGLQPECQQS